MDKTRTTPLHPQSDGMVERFNRTMEEMLYMFVAENQRDWDSHLPILMMAYRSAVHETTSFTPCELMLGRQIDLQLGRPEQESGYQSETEYVQHLQARLDRVHEFAGGNMKLGSERLKRYYDHKAQNRGFERGDPVWLHNPRRKKGRTPKLQRPWKGPYLVTSLLDDLIYRIQKGPRSKQMVVHVDRLKKYQGNSFDNRLAEPNTTSATPTNRKSAEQHVPKSTTAANGLGGVPTAAKGARKRPRRSRRKPAWAADYQMD